MIIEVSDHFSRLNCGHVKKSREPLFISCLVGRWMQTQRFVSPQSPNQRFLPSRRPPRKAQKNNASRAVWPGWRARWWDSPLRAGAQTSGAEGRAVAHFCWRTLLMLRVFWGHRGKCMILPIIYCTCLGSGRLCQHLGLPSIVHGPSPVVLSEAISHCAQHSRCSRHERCSCSGPTSEIRPSTAGKIFVHVIGCGFAAEGSKEKAMDYTYRILRNICGNHTK